MGDISSIVGIDEVGRGCLAGPVVAAAVILRDNIVGLRDSKKMTKKQRESMSATVLVEAIDYGIGWADVQYINKYGLTMAVAYAMTDALSKIKTDYSKIIIDGNFNYLENNPKVETLIKADDKVPAVSAASVIAKVARDKWMTEQSISYPNYGFDKHVGYGTKVHIESIMKHGPCVLHRLNFKPISDLAAAQKTS